MPASANTTRPNTRPILVPSLIEPLLPLCICALPCTCYSVYVSSITPVMMVRSAVFCTAWRLHAAVGQQMSARPRQLLQVVADVLERVRVRQQLLRLRVAERLRVHHRIVDRDFDVHVTEVSPNETLGQAHLLAVRVPGAVEPRLVVEARCLDDERVADPSAD